MRCFNHENYVINALIGSYFPLPFLSLLNIWSWIGGSGVQEIFFGGAFIRKKKKKKRILVGATCKKDQEIFHKNMAFLKKKIPVGSRSI